MSSFVNKQSKKLKHRNNLSTLSTVLFSVLLGLFILIGIQLNTFESIRYKQHEIDLVQEKLNELKSNLTNRVYTNIYTVSAIKSMIAMNPNLTQEDYARGIEMQFKENNDLRNIALAKDMIIKYMYPVQGNEAAIGLDYSTLPEQLESVFLAKDLNKIVLAGPLNLIQGGEGIIARVPIYLKNNELETEYFWGFASVVLKSESLITGAGITKDHEFLNIALRGKNALGAKGEIFWGDEAVFNDNPIVSFVELPYGCWQMAAIPVNGWSSYSIMSSSLMKIYLIAVFVILGFTGFIIFLINIMDKAQKERNLLSNSLEILLKQTSDFIYYKDINSRFIFCSQTLADITNHKHWKDMIGKHDFEVFPHELAVVYNEEEKPVFEEGKSVLNKINPYYSADGEKGFIHTNKWPVFDKNNKVNGIFGISRDITEQIKTNEELIREREKADAANIAKSQFLANMSHEIRTPLNGVIGFTHLLKNTQLSPMQKQFVDNANVSGHTLLTIINDILDFSKIEAGMLDLENTKTDIFQLLENCTDLIKLNAQKKNLEVLLNINYSMPKYAMLDSVRLTQIITNLLSNAVKFTEEGEVELNVNFTEMDQSNGVFLFSVRDTGIGISEENRDKLFKHFSQADNSTTRKYGGSGLGLAISQMLAEKMGSKIVVKSIPDYGSTFSFSINTSFEYDTEKEFSEISLFKNGLIIEDNINNQKILANILYQWQINSVFSNNSLDAIKLIQKSNNLDFILCDFNLPYINGLETVNMIHSKLNISTEELPVIILHSAFEDSDFYNKCDDLKIKFRLVKPVKSNELYEILKELQVPINNNLVKPKQIIKTEKKKILIVEDVEINMILIESILLDIFPDLEIVKAKNGLIAIEEYQNNLPDLILMDLQMPELDGLEATKQIRNLETEKNKQTPVIALTAGALKEEYDKCLAVGMNDFLTKPVDSEKLKSVLLKYLKI